MRTLILSLLVVAAPAAAQPAQDTPARTSAAAIDIMEMAISSRGGVDPTIVLDAADATVRIAYRCFDAVKPGPAKRSATVTLKFRIDNHGAVATATAAGLPSVNACITAALKAHAFNTPNKGAMEVTEKLSFPETTEGSVASSSAEPLPMYGGLTGDSITAKPARVTAVVKIGQRTVQGGLDKEIVSRHVDRNVLKIRYCYEKQLQSKPKLAGTVQAQFAINADGKVATSTATGVDAAVASCIAEAIQSIEFPKPSTGDAVTVNYQFVLRRAGDAATP